MVQQGGGLSCFLSLSLSHGGWQPCGGLSHMLSLGRESWKSFYGAAWFRRPGRSEKGLARGPLSLREDARPLLLLLEGLSFHTVCWVFFEPWSPKVKGKPQRVGIEPPRHLQCEAHSHPALLKVGSVNLAAQNVRSVNSSDHEWIFCDGMKKSHILYIDATTDHALRWRSFRFFHRKTVMMSSLKLFSHF